MNKNNSSIIDKLWAQLKEYRSNIIQVMILGLITSGLRGLVPEFINRLFSAWQNGDRQMAMILPPILTVIWLISCVTRYLNSSKMKYTADLVTVKQRRQLMDKYLSLNLTYFQEFERGSGGLISRMVNDLTVIQNGIHKLADAIREPFMVVGMLLYLLYIDWRLTVFVLFATPIVILILRQIARSLRKYSKDNQETMEDLTRTLKESLDGAKIVQSFGLEDFIREKFNKQALQFLSTRKKIISREESAGPISEGLTVVFISILLLYIGHQVFNSQFTLANFMSFMFAMGLLQDSIRKLQDSYIKLQQASVAFDRLNAILEREPSVKDPDQPLPFPTGWKQIEYRNVSFAYNNEPVLRKINLVVQRSERIALVGSSGSGKSTLVNLLQRFFDPSEGAVLIDGIDIKKFRLSELRQQIALVTQDVFLFNDSIEMNIRLGNLRSDTADVKKSAQLANADKFIQQTPEAYNTNVGDFGSRMSGGEKQRISIARAILKNSPILVLDEATSALDSESELEVQAGLNQLMQGRTAFVIAHRLSTIANSDRIIVMKKGQIVEEGDHQQLVEKKGEYFKFHQMQFINEAN